MGLFSFLSRDQEYLELDTTPVQPVEEEDSGFPEICNEMPVEVVEKSGRVLNTGLITSHSTGELTMGRLPGGLSFKVCPPDSTVYVRGCDNKMMQFYLRATVVESSRTLMQLKDLEPEVHDNHRDTFRLSVNAPISIFYMNDSASSGPRPAPWWTSAPGAAASSRSTFTGRAKCFA